MAFCIEIAERFGGKPHQAHNATAAAAQVTTLDNVVVGDVILLKLRGLDQYAVVQVAGISRPSATDVTVSFNVKAL